MKVLDPGHRYALDNLETGGETILQFYKDPALHDGNGYSGPSCQEVLRAVIDRVQELDREKPDIENAIIIHDLRHAIAAFEGRAMRRRVEKDGLAIERVPVAADGHLLLASADTHPKGEDGTASSLMSGAVGEAETPKEVPMTEPTNEELPWLVWSHEHNAFWRPNRQGYTQFIERAGRYTRAEAEGICRAACPRANSTLPITDFGTVPPEICFPAPEAADRLATLTSEPSEAQIAALDALIEKGPPENDRTPFGQGVVAGIERAKQEIRYLAMQRAGTSR